jgi:hypothetical protein
MRNRSAGNTRRALPHSCLPHHLLAHASAAEERDARKEHARQLFVTEGFKAAAVATVFTAGLHYALTKRSSYWRNLRGSPKYFLLSSIGKQRS